MISPDPSPVARLDPEERRRPRPHTLEPTAQIREHSRDILVRQLLHQTGQLLALALRTHADDVRPRRHESRASTCSTDPHENRHRTLKPLGL